MLHQVEGNHQIATDYFNRYKSQTVRRCDGLKPERGVGQSERYHFGPLVMAVDQPVITVNGLRGNSQQVQAVVEKDSQGCTRFPIHKSQASGKVFNTSDP